MERESMVGVCKWRCPMGREGLTAGVPLGACTDAAPRPVAEAAQAMTTTECQGGQDLGPSHPADVEGATLVPPSADAAAEAEAGAEQDEKVFQGKLY